MASHVIELITMDMIPVRSSAISAVGYDPTSLRMVIKFKGGYSYTFCRVPEHIFTGLIQSTSKGRYYDSKIRDRYQC
jgi:hypothetical protein